MGEKICLKASNLATTLADVLYQYQQNRILCDCCIQCSDGEVYAHKIILAMWGLYGFYIDTIDTIQALKFTTAEVSNFMKLIYSGKNSLDLDAALKVAQFGKQIGIKLCCISSSPLQEPLESTLCNLKSCSYVELNDEENILHIKSMPDYKGNFSTTTNVRCREPVKRTISVSGNTITDKGDKNLRKCSLSQASDVRSTILIDENKSPESPIDTTKDGEDSSEHEKTATFMSYSDNPPKIVIEVKAENCEQPDSGCLDMKAEEQENYNQNSDMEALTGSAEALETAENNSVSEQCIERREESHTESTNNKSKRKKESQSYLRETSQKKTKVQKDEGEKCDLIKCRHCVRKKRDPFLYADTTEGLELFYKHVVQSHASATIRNMTCEICGFTYKDCQADMYMDHKVRKHGLEYDSSVYSKMTCDFENCKYWTLCKSKFRVHKRDVHSGKREVCSVCGISVKSIKDHSVIHQDRPRLPCEICGKTFTNAYSIKLHIEKVHERKYKTIGFCSYCNKSFTERYTYLNHMYREHKEIPEGIKRYQCTECDFVTYQNAMMKNHELRHKELKGLKIEKNYKCQICGKSFTNSTRRNSHVQEYHVKKVYQQCPYDNCNKVFSRKQYLKIHIRSLHENGKEFQCHICPYKCNRQGNLVKHIRGVHKQEVSTIDSRQKQAMLSGKGYYEANNKNPKGDQEDGQSEGDNSL